MENVGFNWLGLNDQNQGLNGLNIRFCPQDLFNLFEIIVDNCN